MMAVHPGEILAEELRERGISQRTFAEQIGMRPSHLCELLHGKISVTKAIADKLQDALGVDSQSWVNLQTQYNYDVQAQKKECESKTTKLEVSVEDASLLVDIKRAITMIRGVREVDVVV